MDKKEINTALLIAYHFPPVQVSSGLQRTLAFSTYLPESHWSPMVLSAHPRAYLNLDNGQLKDIPTGVQVERAFALDTGRHLSVRGRYLDFMALPDRWVTWWLGGVLSGLKMIRKHKPKVIWSTYPIATAHLIGLTLHKLTGLPWVADFRDSMTEDTYPREGIRRKVFLWIERHAVKACGKAIFTTPSAVSMYRQRYPEIPRSRWALIPNGYNEEIFSEVEKTLPKSVKAVNKKTTLLHSGVIYPSERDPKPFFTALSELKNKKIIDSSSFNVVLRATGHDDLFSAMLKQFDIEDIVQLAAGISYRDALAEMLQADGLLVFQASNCNHQIPAKIYEYFRAQRPVFALTDSAGDTAATLKEAGINSIVPLDNAEAIEDGLIMFLNTLATRKAEVANVVAVKKYSRQYAAKELASIFDGLVE
jgi:hypothetical protein